VSNTHEGPSSVAVALVKLMDQYPNTKTTESTLSAYENRLHDIPEAFVLEAIDRCAVTSEWFPSLKAIREEAIELMVGAKVDPESAWGEVERKARQFGLKRERVIWAPGREAVMVVPLSWSTPFVAQAVEAIGWEEICTTDMEKHGTAIRAQFREALKAVQDRAYREANIALVGGHGASLSPGSAMPPVSIEETVRKDRP
jgi:hypothetical protein